MSQELDSLIRFVIKAVLWGSVGITAMVILGALVAFVLTRSRRNGF